MDLCERAKTGVILFPSPPFKFHKYLIFNRIKGFCLVAPAILPANNFLNGDSVVQIDVLKLSLAFLGKSSQAQSQLEKRSRFTLLPDTYVAEVYLGRADAGRSNPLRQLLRLRC